MLAEFSNRIKLIVRFKNGQVNVYDVNREVIQTHQSIQTFLQEKQNYVINAVGVHPAVLVVEE